MSSAKNMKAFLSDRCKEFDSSSNAFILVGSNPTECICFIFSPHTHSTSFDLILLGTETPQTGKQSLIHISTDIISKHNIIKHSSNNLNTLPLLDCDSIGRIIYIQLQVLFYPREDVMVDQSRAMGWCNGQYNLLFMIQVYLYHNELYSKMNWIKHDKRTGIYLGILRRGVPSLGETK